MPRTAIAIQSVPRNGGAVLALATPDAANGNNFANDGKTELVVLNTDAAPHTVTVRSVADAFGRTGDVPVVVPAAVGAVPGTAFLGPYEQNLFNQPDGTVNVDWTASTGMKVGTRQA
jgi:hypothetical protein